MTPPWFWLLNLLFCSEQVVFAVFFSFDPWEPVFYWCKCDKRIQRIPANSFYNVLKFSLIPHRSTKYLASCKRTQWFRLTMFYYLLNFLFLVLGAHIVRTHPQQSLNGNRTPEGLKSCASISYQPDIFFPLLEFSSMNDAIWNKFPHSEIPREAQWRATKMMKCFQNKTLEEEVRNQTCSASCQEDLGEK